MRPTLLALALALIAAPAHAAPADEFLKSLAGLCGQAFQGRIVAMEPPNPNDAFSGKTLTMHVRECGPDAVKIPFHVGDDRSRTWVLTRTGTGLRLKHDHRHQDGTEDKITQYGGDTAAPGTASRQEFPVDDFSKAMFKREGLPERAQSNIWAMEVGKAAFVYELSSTGRLFRVEFDLSKPVPPPPAPWGHK